MLFYSADERVDVIVEGFKFSEFNIAFEVSFANYITVHSTDGAIIECRAKDIFRSKKNHVMVTWKDFNLIVFDVGRIFWHF